MKRGFTLVELILVIIIMSILALFGSNIYGNIYKNYIYARSVDLLESKTELVLEQIAARLSKRVHISAIARKSDTEYTSIEQSNDEYKILEFMEKSEAGKNVIAKNRPALGWSGFVYLEESNATRLKTPGSHLKKAKEEIARVTDKGTSNLGLIFLNGQDYMSVDNFGYGQGSDFNTSNIALANLDDSNGEDMAINLSQYEGKITERYYLIDSSIAIVPSELKEYEYTSSGKEGKKKSKFKDFDLTLYYDYRPWLGESYKDGKSVILAQNVTLFRFRGNYGSLDLKICLRDKNIPDADFIVCKSKVVQ